MNVLRVVTHLPGFILLSLLPQGSFGAVLWHVGQDDQSAAEFALAPDRYSDFLVEDFGWPDRFYYVGRSKPGADWPYVLPGPSDAWAGSMSWSGIRTQHLNIVFELEERPEAAGYQLVVDLVDVSPSEPPRLRATVNGRRFDFKVQPGAAVEVLRGDFDAGREQVLIARLAENDLRKGINEITLTSIQGSWAVFDQVRLEGPVAARRADSANSLIRSVRTADYELQTDGKRTQPLLIDVEMIGEEGEMEVRLGGRSLWRSRLEPGRAILEAPMPPVEGLSEAEVEVLIDGKTRYRGHVERAPARLQTPADYVDPFLGTAHSRWMIAPGPWMPYGMVKLSPNNQNHGWQSGYEPTIENVGGFSHIHEWTMAGLLMMPTNGPLRIEVGDQYHPDEGYRSRIDVDRETARIGFYRTFLSDYGIEVELTATKRAGLQRYRFPKNEHARVLIDLQIPAEYDYDIHDCMIRRVDEHRIEGFSHQISTEVWPDTEAQEYTVYFVIEFDHPIQRFGHWIDNAITWDEREVETGRVKDVGAIVEFNAEKELALLARSAISLVSIDQARLNLEREMRPFGWDFEAVVEHQRKAWNDILSRVEIETADAREKKRFYSNMYRAWCARTIWSDVNGKWVDPLERVQQLDDPESPVFGCDAYWNTFWNLNQLWNLVTPAWSNAWARSQLALYQATGWLAKGPAGMEYIPVMVAEHEIPFLVAAWQHGIRNFDGDQALEAMIKMQTTTARRIGGGLAGNRDLIPYLEFGYVPHGLGHDSNTMEYAYDDWCVAQMGKALGREDVYKRFLRRSTFWRNLFDEKTGFVRPKNIDGEWIEPYDPFNAKGFTEGNAWQYTWFVPQNPSGLVEAMGRKRFIDRLNYGFENSEPFRFNAPNEQYSDYPLTHGNQPAMQVAWLFNWADAPWLTQKWNRAIQERYYGYGFGDAYLGDEDQGQMSAWFIMSAIGLFQVDGGCHVDPIYEIGSPRYPRVTLQLDSQYYPGESFVIEARNASRQNKYVQSATLNGEPLERWWIFASAVQQGGRLVLEMGPEPNERWARNAAPTR